jgi:outer membrane protein assembly factor BamB
MRPRPGVDWPSFRGLDAAGVSDGYPTPVSFNAERSENILWKTRIPGLGHSSPVIWGDRIYVTSAVGATEEPSLKVGLYGDIAPVPDEGEQRFILYSLDKKTGAILWERTARTAVPAIKRHTKATHANSTPATDGRHVAVFFGSEGLYLYDADGTLLWQKDLGLLDAGYYVVPQAQWGFGSSPVIQDGKVIVQCDVQGGGFIAAFRLEDGQELWRTKREDVPTWSTPTVHGAAGSRRVVANGWKQIGAYDMETGQPVWWMKGGGDIPVPTPIVSHGLIFITNAHGPGSPVYAIQEGATGEISAEEGSPLRAQIAWSIPRGGAYMQTPLVYGDLLYVCRDSGVLKVYDAKHGTVLSDQRIGDGSTGFTPSGVAGDGKLYYTSEAGQVFVLSAGAQPQVLATNELGEVTMATPALSEGVLYVRSRNNLRAVGTPAASAGAGK